VYNTFLPSGYFPAIYPFFNKNPKSRITRFPD
jgi:hypothetical protein